MTTTKIVTRTPKEPTTDLKEIRYNGAPFTWGRVVRIHDVGRYSIVEHVRGASAPSDIGDSFHPYVDGKDTRRSFGTLDQALVGAVAHGNLEVNDADHMTTAALRVLGLERAK